jgi:hypothetical protein
MRRGELIPDTETAVLIIQSDRPMIHEKTVLSAAQLKTWPVGRIIEKIREKKLFRALPNYA